MPATFNPSSVDKAFGLLEFLATATRPSSLQEVTEAVNLPKPTAYRLLQSMQKLGYVSRPAGTRNYLIGPRAERLASSNPFASLKTAAQPLLRRINEEFNETVNLGILSGQSVSYLQFLETTQALRFIVSPGQSDPYYCTALGRAIASQLADKALDRLLAETRFQSLTPSTVKDAAQMRDLIAKTRRRGYAEESEESVLGVTCLAASLAPLGYPGAAISAAVPTQRLTTRRRADIVRALKELTQSKT